MKSTRDLLDWARQLLALVDGPGSAWPHQSPQWQEHLRLFTNAMHQHYQNDSHHEYVSTACQHGVHVDCRQWCKFCRELCRCVCHPRGTYPLELGEPPHDRS